MGYGRRAASAILVVALLASAVAVGAPPAERIEIGGVVHARILKLPPPKRQWNGKTLRPTVREYLGRAVLEFENVRAASSAPWLPEPSQTLVKQLHGVVDVKGAKQVRLQPP